MAKDVITIDGKDEVVREDKAKSYRGIMWALTSIAIFIAILAVIFLGGFLKTVNDGNLESPSKIEEKSH